MPDDTHEVYAIRYGHHSRRSPANFIDGDPHDILQPLDFFVWAIIGSSGAIVVDTGSDEAMGKKRQREMIKPDATDSRRSASPPTPSRPSSSATCITITAAITSCFRKRAIICRILRWPTPPAA